jgi:glutamine synthetase
MARASDGRVTSPPTIEFRLPDGSALPHLLLAGVAQCMLAARESGDVDEVLAGAASGRPEEGAEARLPRSLAGIAEALEAQRAVFEAAGVFPPGSVDQAIRSLRS